MNQVDKALSDFNAALRFYSTNNGTPEEIALTKNRIKKMEEERT